MVALVYFVLNISLYGLLDYLSDNKKINFFISTLPLLLSHFLININFSVILFDVFYVAQFAYLKDQIVYDFRRSLLFFALYWLSLISQLIHSVFASLALIILLSFFAVLVFYLCDEEKIYVAEVKSWIKKTLFFFISFLYIYLTDFKIDLINSLAIILPYLYFEVFNHFENTSFNLKEDRSFSKIMFSYINFLIIPILVSIILKEFESFRISSNLIYVLYGVITCQVYQLVRTALTGNRVKLVNKISFVNITTILNISIIYRSDLELLVACIVINYALYLINNVKHLKYKPIFQACQLGIPFSPIFILKSRCLIESLDIMRTSINSYLFIGMIFPILLISLLQVLKEADGE